MMDLLVNQPRRMLAERQQLDTLARTETWFKVRGWSQRADGGLEVEFTLELTQGDKVEAVLVYPVFYPDVAAYVRPKNHGEAWSGHQYPGTGVLCLEYGPDNWHEGVTGVDLVKSANKLVWQEFMRLMSPRRAPGIPSRHTTTVGQYLRNANKRFILTSAFLKAAAAQVIGTAQPLVLLTYSNEVDTVSMVKEVGNGPAMQLLGNLTLPAAAPQPGLLVRIEAPAPSRALARDELLELVPTEERVQAKGKAIVLCDTNSSIRVFNLPEADTEQPTELTVLDATEEHNPRLPEKYTKLSSLHVTIAGMGSLGSKVAVSLARCGFRSFCLIDVDVLMPHNLVRHDMDWRSVGQAKVDAVAERIYAVAPDATVLALPFDVAGQENPMVMSEVANVVGKSHLVIDATAEAHAFLTLASVCKRAAVPMVWGEVFAGGFGGLIARSRPTKDAAPAILRRHIQNVMNTLAPVPKVEVKRYSAETDGQVFTADDACVTWVAGILTSFAVDVVLNEQEPDFPYPAYLLGFKKFWEFDQPFDTKPIADPELLSDTTPEENLTEQDAKAFESFQKLVKGRSNGASNNHPG